MPGAVSRKARAGPWPPRSLLFSLLALAVALALLDGCTDRRERAGAERAIRSGGQAHVVPLGNLSVGRPPTPAQVRLAVFLFGAEPDPGLALIKPMDLAAAGGDLLVSDGALQSVLRWRMAGAVLEDLPGREWPSGPQALAVAPNGDWLVGDATGVTRLTTSGRAQIRYALRPEHERMRPGGVAVVGEEVWITNTPAHRIEVFDAASGQPRRTIGQRGRGPGEFGLPLGLTVRMSSSGNEPEVLVADMLNARVQVLSRAGQWLRDIGGPGDRTGYFGRPRTVTVGPDGVIFVTDAASQCVHAFTSEGRPLLRFGGSEDGSDALVLPAGILTWSGPLPTSLEPPAGFQVDYYVLVAEQIRRPGLRVYGWSAPRPEQLLPPRRPRTPTVLAEAVTNPHWRSDGCTTCHESSAGRMAAPAPAETDALCLSCHDGRRASREPHPIGRLAEGPHTIVPPGWPLVDGRIGCLTCHDIRRQCDAPDARPYDNPALVRGFDPRNPMASCLVCHTTQTWRVNPHRSEVAGFADGAAGCGFCHVSVPRPAAGADPGGGTAWEFDARLRAPATTLCLNCHTMHADPAPEGHLGQMVSPEMKARMIAAEGRRSASSGGGSVAEPEWLRLEEGRVGCATCHNPHPPDGIPAELVRSEYILRRSSAAADSDFSLRMDQMDLCRHCHGK